MHLISHRGNIFGKNPEKENSPEYIIDALSLGYDVEIDIWYLNGRYFLGHDNPTYEVAKDFINDIKDKSWFHCKNEAALSTIGDDFDQINFFWHESDKYTLTSMGYIWSFPGEKIVKNSIILFPENYPDNKNEILLSSGICSDYIADYKIYKNIEKIQHDEYNILLKLKNPIYNFFTHSERYYLAGNAEIKSFYSDLVLIQKDFYRDINTLHYDHIFPTVTRFSANEDSSIEEENVFIYSFTPRYYHNLTELFPKLIKLKKIDPNFVFIFAAWQKQNRATDLVGESPDDTKDLYYDYIIEFLDLLDIKYKFIYKENFDQFTFKNSYIFYEKFNGECDGFEQHWDRCFSIKGYSHCHMFYSTDPFYITESLKYIWDYFNNFNDNLNLQENNSGYPKKIFISRKNFYSRKDLSIVNKNNKFKEEAVEKVFEENGYHIVNMEDFTFLEQLKLSHNAKVIACFVGSSVLNAFYSNKDVKVFYLNPLNKEYNNEPHLKGYYKFILDLAGIQNRDYDVDMNTAEFNELRNILQTL
jgi:hypothetical protein